MAGSHRSHDSDKYLGFDLSTQQLKAIVINNRLEICHQVCVDFDNDLPHWKTRGGVLVGPEHDRVRAPVFMWLEALELCLEKLINLKDFDIKSIVCVSGACQRHGSVWWKDAGLQLSRMDPDKNLMDNLGNPCVFAMVNTPVWMDSSSLKECVFMDAYVNGIGQRIADITGSRVHERFTGSQIMKVFHDLPDVYAETKRIMLISNFIASILAGSFMPFDISDACGMNMLDIRTQWWSQICLEAITSADQEPESDERRYSLVSSLLARLGASRQGIRERGESLDRTVYINKRSNVIETRCSRLIGTISPYFQQRFGFSPACRLASFTGDTPTSMAGLCVKPDEFLISLGTSDTSCFWLSEPRNIPNGHMSRLATNPDAYLGLVSFKNGSKTRERLRDKYCKRSPENEPARDWAEFNELLCKSPPGNNGFIGFYFDMQEIYPRCKGDFRFDSSDNQLSEFEKPEQEIRACIEGQFLRFYNHLNLDLTKISCIKLTGGGSKNHALLQVIADIFGKPVHVCDIPNSACLGAAYLAKWDMTRNFFDNQSEMSFENVIVKEAKSPTNMIVNPQKDASKIYKDLAKRYGNLESKIQNERGDKMLNEILRMG